MNPTTGRRRRTRAPGRMSRMLVTATLAVGLPVAVAAPAAAGPCDAPVNVIACENSLPGTPQDNWFSEGGSYGNTDGFGTKDSVQPGQPLPFKVRTTATAWTINIVRMGWYGGTGGRQVATVDPSVPLPQSQPACLTTPSTGLVDCGNWAVSATWQVPDGAVSGVYLANIVRTDGTPGFSQFPFVVRDESSHSDIVVQTSDQEWQAYNAWGGNSLYVGGAPTSDGRAYKVSYNRPYNNSGTANFLNAEYPLIRWLERNGYDVSYLSGVDVSRNGALVRNHKVFVSSGHDEYWSGPQRSAVEAARAAGVHLAFLSGNEMFWKTRFEPSIDGSNTAYRTLVCYKETKAQAKIDPDPAWTGTWRDPVVSPPADGGRPENALTGTLFRVNGHRVDAMTVPAAYAGARIWRDTSVAGLTGSQMATFAAGTLGYEWDESSTNSVRPDGALDLSSTTITVGPEQLLLDEGNAYGSGPATHRMVMYRDQTSRALVFGTGTVQWSWGLDAVHLYPHLPVGTTIAPDVRIQQATVNVLADMGSQPSTLQAGLVAATASSDTTGPAVTVASPAAGADVPAVSATTISGTATDSSGVARVEVSTDAGITWREATGTTSWTFAWTPTALGSATILARGVDRNVNIGAVATRAVTVGSQQCPCTLFGATTPATPDAGDTSTVEVGVKFTPTVNGRVTGVRFYKGTANTGTHTGSVWSSAGARLATGTFAGESASGWQTLTFASPLAVSGGTTYVASYFSNGHYAADGGWFATRGAGVSPLTAPRDGTSAGGQGVYRYGGGFPDNSFGAANYWVDVVFDTSASSDTTPPVITSTTPADGATGVGTRSAVTARFNEAVDPPTLAFALTGPGGAAVAGITDTTDSGTTATFTPTAALDTATTYTASVRAEDGFGNRMTAARTWSFTTGSNACPCNLFGLTAPALASASDVSQVELGVKFRTSVDATVTAVRFYKSAENTGTHTGSLWTSTGTRLATGTFTGESASGWQTLTFATPVAISADTTYIASYNAPNGRYAYAGGYFAASGAGSAPLTAPSDAAAGGQGVYRYGTAFPDATYNAANYYVDVIVTTAAGGGGGGDTAPPTVSSTAPASGATGVATSASVSATMSEPVAASGSQFTLTSAGGTAVAGTVSASGNTITFNPGAALAAGTVHTASLRATDTAGNLMASAHTWSFTTAAAADTTPPAISAVGASGSGTSATVTWTTNEPSDSRVTYGTSPGTLDLAAGNGAMVTAHSVALTGLAPNTRYHYRVVSTDASGNAATSPLPPAAPLSYAPPVSPRAQTTVADFSTGSTLSGTYVGDESGGEVVLAPVLATEFAGTAIPAGFTSAVNAAGGTATVAGGALTVNGARVASSATYAAGRSVEFRATFPSGSNGTDQVAGFGNSAVGSPFAAFWDRAGRVYARTNTGTGATVETALSTSLDGSEHTYRVQRTTAGFAYYVDGTLRATHTPDQSALGTLPVQASDAAANGPSLSVQWLRVGPYASSGTFLSSALDAGAPVAWGALSRTATVPSGTTLTMAARTGNTATPDASWTPFVNVANGASIGSTGRYVQYRLTHTATAPAFVTPMVSAVTVAYAIP